MSQLLIHRSPLGPLSIPGVLGEPAPGEPFEVDDETARDLLEQGDLYAPAPAPEVTEKELRKMAADRGVDLTGARNKTDIAARIADHDDAVTVGNTEDHTTAADAASDDTQEGGDQL